MSYFLSQLFLAALVGALILNSRSYNKWCQKHRALITARNRLTAAHSDFDKLMTDVGL